MKNKVKFTIIGAGNICFCPTTVADILRSSRFESVDNITIYLMDIQQSALDVSRAFLPENGTKIKQESRN
jgi:alpha-galactosidase/6-phospho-beta-glucosidase family protein